MPAPPSDAVRDPRRLEAVDRAEVASRHDLPVLQRLTRAAARHTGSELGFLSLVHRDVEVLVAVHADVELAVPPSIVLEESLCRELVEDGRSLFVHDLADHPRMSRLETARALGVRSYAGSPVTAEDGQVLGGLCVAGRSPHLWTTADEELLGDLAAAVTAQLRGNVSREALRHLERSARRRADQQAALHRVASAVARGEDPSLVLRLVAEELARLLEVDSAHVLRFVPGGVEVASAAGRPVAGPASLEAVAERVRLKAAPTLHETGALPFAAVPVTLHGQTWGVVVVTGAASSMHGTLPQLVRLADSIELVISNTEAQTRLAQLARTDSLTGAANRRAFDERLTVELERCRRHGGPLALALLDVDVFKAINDDHGHDVGDEVLVELTTRVQAELRAVDLLARIGGDEFGLVLPQTGAEAAFEVMDRLRTRMQDAEVAGVPVTITVGGAVTTSSCDGEELYRGADRALYAAKRRGRNRTVVVELG